MFLVANVCPYPLQKYHDWHLRLLHLFWGPVPKDHRQWLRKRHLDILKPNGFAACVLLSGRMCLRFVPRPKILTAHQCSQLRTQQVVSLGRQKQWEKALQTLHERQPEGQVGVRQRERFRLHPFFESSEVSDQTFVGTWKSCTSSMECGQKMQDSSHFTTSETNTENRCKHE